MSPNGTSEIIARKISSESKLYSNQIEFESRIIDNEGVERGPIKLYHDHETKATKAKLMKYASDTKWILTRKILFIVFLSGWFVMLVHALMIVNRSK